MFLLQEDRRKQALEDSLLPQMLLKAIGNIRLDLESASHFYIWRSNLNKAVFIKKKKQPISGFVLQTATVVKAD